MLFYFPECLDLRAICPHGKTEIVQFWYFSFIECICNDDGQSCTFEVFQWNDIEICKWIGVKFNLIF